jgi:hypothetical protein
MKTKLDKDELIYRWAQRAEIEDGIADVYQRHDQNDKANEHLEIARTWRQAVVELRDDLADEKQ